MSLNILIVEDQFIEANDLSNILQKAGHRIAGVAKSVEQALAILEKATPDMVLLDIFLKGPLTGIDLAGILGKENIPFIYLSANSNPSTLEAAKATRPHGFLVKPYRAKDILVALDIANDRHQYALELKVKQSKWLNDILTGILHEDIDPDQKLISLVLAFKTFLPFDYLLIDTNTADKSLSSLYSFQRMGYNDYKRLDGWDLLKLSGLTIPELLAFRSPLSSGSRPAFRNDGDFTQLAEAHKITEIIAEHYGVQSNLWFPLPAGGTGGMALSFYGVEPDNYHEEHVALLQSLSALIGEVIKGVWEHKSAIIKTTPLKTALQNKAENPALQHIVGNSPKLLAALDQVNQVATSEASVLILGETGVGKEGLVKAIHLLSSRRSKPFIRINCAAIPGSLVESELFGHERGAFTGATERRIGKFEQAQGSTIFLDEIGEMPFEVQSKLLRVIQEKELERVGGRTTIKVDVRIVAATNRDLYKEVAAGKFRIDLYYRINVFPITLAPLRERKEDIPVLAAYFLKKHAGQSGSEKKLSPGAMQTLMHYSWPGNIRELQHLIERHALLSPSAIINNIDLPADDITAPQADAVADFQSIADIDKAHIIAALTKCNGKVSGKGGAAELLKIPSTTLASKMKRLGITWGYLAE